MDQEPPIEKVVEVKKVSEASPRTRTVYKIIQVIWYIIGVIIVLLLLRFVLALLGANLDNVFASFIYDITEPLVAPFRGLLQVGEFHAGVVRVEIETLLASLVYALIGWGVVSAVGLAAKE
jgi:YggT family protein